jgi:CelD/BcsL family acetyltransferase involved in cellulose biosynthesis
MAPLLTGELLETPAAIEPYRADWDRLAVESGRPYCAPAWALSWWRHAGPARGHLRVVAALDGGRLAGIAPLGMRRWLGLSRYSFLGSEVTARVEPLARSGLEAPVAAAIASTLAGARPGVDLLEFTRVPADSDWPALLAGSWPGARRPWVRAADSVSAPVVTLDAGTFDEWMGGKSSNFRQQMRRGRRQLEAKGARFRAATHSDLDRDVEGFVRLHHARWAARGGSDALGPGAREALAAAGRDLLDSERFRLEAIEIDGELISSHLFLAAGGEASYWLGGFDERLAAQRPAMVSLVAAVEDGLRRGERRLDLGPGAQEYKHRLANDEDRLHNVTLAPRSRRYAAARLALALRDARRELMRRIPPDGRRRLGRRLRGVRTRPNGEDAPA